jgi:hypothetical protein
MVNSSNSERLLLYVCLAVLGAACYDLVIENAAVPSCMRYIPPESSAYVVTSPLRTLWRGAQPHLERFFDPKASSQNGAGEAANETFANGLARSIKKGLEEKRIVLRNPDDLPALGIDPGSNVAVAIVLSSGGEHFILAVPLVDGEKFKDTLAKCNGARVAPVEGTPLSKAGDTYLAFGRNNTALLSDDASFLQKILDTQDQNLAYFRSSDRIVRGFAALLPGRQGRSDAWLRGNVSMAAISVPLASDMQFVLSMNQRVALLRARLTLPDGRSELAARLLTEPHLENAMADQVLTRGNGSAIFADDSLPYFLRYIYEKGAPESMVDFDGVFPGLLEELRTVSTLHQVSVAASEESQRVPGVILGFRMSSEEAENLVFRLQSAVRLKRDREILRAATARYRVLKGTDEAGQVPLDVLLAGGFLSDQRAPLWSRYRFDGDEATPNPTLSPQDFANETFEKWQANFAVKYILPPVTIDDISYRLKQGKNVDEGELKRDKYRACSSYVAGTLWFANDGDILSRWLTRLSQTDVGTDYSDATTHSKDEARAKLTVFVRPRDLLDSGQLYPNSKVNDQARLLLSDLSQYRALLIGASTNRVEREVYVSVTLLLF